MAMNGNGSWLANPNTSNKFGNSYVNSFIDMSGGNLILRNNHIIIKSGDINVAGLISQDLTQATVSRDLSASMVPLSTVVNNFITNQVNTFSALNTFSQGITVSTNPMTVQSQLVVAGDASFASRLFVGSDCSLAGNVNITGTMTCSGGIAIGNDVSMNGRLSVSNDVSLNGNLSVSGNITIPTSGIHTITGTVTTGNSSCTTSLVTGNDTVTGNETISGTVYANGGFYGTSGKTITVTGNVLGVSTGTYLTTSTSSVKNVSTTNYGNNWQGLVVSTGLVTNGAYASVSCSSTGQYMTTCVTGGLVYVSSSYGNLWASTGVTLPTTSGYPATAVSSTGQYMLASSSRVYLSSNYGANWTDLSGAGLPTAITSATFRCLSTSSTGQYMVTCTTGSNGQVFLSSNYGQTWLANPGNTLSTTANFYAVNMSSTGQYILAAINAGLVYLSNDYGQSWASSGLASAAYYALGMNSTGQYMAACINGGLVWLSTNYGQTWATIAGLTAANYQSISMSSTGQYMAVGIYGGLVYGSKNFGQTWTSTGLASANYSGIAVSATGEYMLTCVNGGQVYMTVPSNLTVTSTTISGLLSTTDLSLNGNLYTNMMSTSIVPMTRTYTAAGVGRKWQTLGAANGLLSSAAYRSVSMNSTGQYMLATNWIATGLVYLSSNYGQSFGPVNLTAARYFASCISDTGQFMLIALYDNVANTGTIYVSSNYGVSWTNPASIAVPTAKFFGVSISSTGQYMLAGSNTAYFLWRSVDYGITWANSGLANDSYIASSISATGQYMVAINYSNTATTKQIQLSSNYGVSWTAVGPSKVLYRDVSISATGQYILASTDVDAAGGGVFLSINYGGSFNTVGTYTGAWSVNVSSTGQYMLLGRDSGTIWLSTDYGTTWTSVGPLGSTTVLSCAISTNGQYMLAGTGDAGGSVYLSNTSDLSYSTVLTNVPYMNIRGYVGFSDMSGSYLNPSASAKALVEINGTNGTTGSNVDSYSLFTSGSILSGQNLVVASDRRIKNNIIDVVDVSALDVIRQLKPKQYTYIDTKGRGPNPVWGYIAQEVGEVLDYAVNKTTEYIPNVYTDAVVDGNQLTCPGIRTKILGHAETGPSETSLQRPVSLKMYNALGQLRYATVSQIMDDDETAYFTESLTDGPENWFVFGQLVHDFNALDKMAVYTVATAALQELDREHQETKNEVADLTIQMEEILRQLTQEQVADATNDASADTTADASANQVVDEVTDIVNELVDNVSIETIVELVTEPVVELVTEPVVEPVTEPILEPVTEPIVEPVTEPVTEPIVELVTEPIVELVTEPVTEPVVEPVSEPVVEPLVEPVTEPIVVEPVTEPVVEPVVE